jgi:hypothetical protein
VNLTAQQAALAWAQGKIVEASYNGGTWILVSPPGETQDPTKYNPSAFCHSQYTFRLAAEPVMRPLTIEEWKGRVGSVVKLKNTGNIVVVSGVDNIGVFPALFQRYTPSEMLERWEFSDGSDGSPCGVEVES